MINRKYNTILRDISKEDEDDDGIEVEITEYPYFDDNLDFVGSTDNVVDSKTGRFIAVIDFDADGEGKVRICPHCEEYGFHHKLGPRILQKGEQKAPDYDDWLSCYECGNTFPRYQTFVDSKIKDSIQTTDNPFDSNQTTVLGIDSRATQRRKGKKPRSKRLKIEEHEDPEIEAELNKGNSVTIMKDY